MRVGQAQAKARPIAERVHDLVAEVVQVDDDLGNPVPLEEQEVPLEDRPPCNRQQRLWQGLGQRAQPGAEPCGQDHRLH